MNEDGTKYLCPWRENFWKYDEIKSLIVVVKAQKGGLDINRLDLTFLDYIKIGALQNYLQ